MSVRDLLNEAPAAPRSDPTDVPAPPTSPVRARRLLTAARRSLGLALLLLSALPLYRLLDAPSTGLAGASSVEHAAAALGTIWWGAVLVLIPALLAGLWLSDSGIRTTGARLGRLLRRPSPRGFAVALGLMGVALTAAFSLLALDGRPNLVDGLVQSIHGRYLAAGQLTGPADAAAFWQIQNSVVSPAGWVSQYPPGHALLLAFGWMVGTPWLIGPLLMGVAVTFTSLAAERLFPDRQLTARVGALLVGLSPFLIFLAGSYMNHATAAALSAAAIWAGLRARDRSWRAAVIAGMSLGLLWITRPLTAVAVAGVATFGVWLTGQRPARDHGWWLTRMAAAVAGAVPFILAQAWYNARVFGHPFHFGYTAASGPAHGLGFHLDPWGNHYGVPEAIGYVSADLVALSLHLFEAPFPVVAMIGVFLLTVARLEPGERVIVAWAALTLLGSALYWHHDYVLGPRMLSDAAPAWVLLGVTAAAWLFRRLPERVSGPLAFSPRPAFAAAVAAALGVGLLFNAPQRAIAYAQWRPSMRTQPPVVAAPALVFVHGGWTGRIGMTLAAAGMRLDSIETALRQNATCDVHLFASAYAGIEPLRAAPVLDFEPRASDLPPQVELSPGNRIRYWPGEQLAPACEREAAADRRGVIDLAPLLMLGDLPGLGGNGVTYVRDLGPERNRVLVQRYADREAFVLLSRSAESPPELLHYEHGMHLLWGSS